MTAQWKMYIWILSVKYKVVLPYLMFIGPCIIVIVEEWNNNLMSLGILFQFLSVHHVSDINISIIRSLRLCCWITTSVVLFSVRCVLEVWCGWFWVVLLMMDILMSETCWAHKKWNKIASDIKLVFHSSPNIHVCLFPTGSRRWPLYHNLQQLQQCQLT